VSWVCGRRPDHTRRFFLMERRGGHLALARERLLAVSDCSSASQPRESKAWPIWALGGAYLAPMILAKTPPNPTGPFPPFPPPSATLSEVVGLGQQKTGPNHPRYSRELRPTFNVALWCGYLNPVASAGASRAHREPRFGNFWLGRRSPAPCLRALHREASLRSWPRGAAASASSCSAPLGDPGIVPRPPESWDRNAQRAPPGLAVCLGPGGSPITGVPSGVKPASCATPFGSGDGRGLSEYRRGRSERLLFHGVNPLRVSMLLANATSRAFTSRPSFSIVPAKALRPSRKSAVPAPGPPASAVRTSSPRVFFALSPLAIGGFPWPAASVTNRWTPLLRLGPAAWALRTRAGRPGGVHAAASIGRRAGRGSLSVLGHLVSRCASISLRVSPTAGPRSALSNGRSDRQPTSSAARLLGDFRENRPSPDVGAFNPARPFFFAGWSRSNVHEYDTSPPWAPLARRSSSAPQRGWWSAVLRGGPALFPRISRLNHKLIRRDRAFGVAAFRPA